MALAPSMRFPVAGRAASGVGAIALAVPLCRAAGITTRERSAKRLGRAVAVIDAVGVAAVVLSSEPSGQRRAALANTSIDALGAVALLALAMRRSGSERAIS